MTPTTIHLVRHATHASVGSVLVGRTPCIGLDEAGTRQAARLAARFRSAEVTVIGSSPMQRAMETADPIGAACTLGVVVVPGIEEIDFGDWTGKTFDALSSDPAWSSWNRGRGLARAPNGEAMHEAQSRALSALASLRAMAPGGVVVAVSHGDIIRGVLCAVLGMPLDRIHSLTVDPASVSTLLMWPERADVLGINHPA